MAAFSSCFTTSPVKCQPLQKSLLGSQLPSYSSSSSSSQLSFKPSRSAASYLKNGAIKCASETEVIQPTADATVYFHPTVWDSNYIISKFTTDQQDQVDTVSEKRLEELKNEVKTMFSLAANDSFQELDLIDKLQRLGLAYHFETQIENIFERISNQGTSIFDTTDKRADDLNLNSIWFRVMRHSGYRVPTDVFNKFKSDNGEFRENLASDVHAMLSLYEASHMSINGEGIMDEALAFATKHLNSMLLAPGLSPALELEIKFALKQPIQQTVERVQTRHFINVYQHHETHNPTLLEFAKLDFNWVQKIHQKELAEFLGWYEDLNMRSKVPFDTRDRGVESYLIPSAILFEPQYSLARVQLAKVWAAFTILDDANDVYGDVEELRPLCDAIQKWDDADFESMTDLMKIVFLDIFNLVNEVEHDMIKKGHFVGLPYFRSEVQRYAQGQFDEAKIIFTKNLPTVEECIEIFFLTAGLLPYLVNSTMHMPAIAKKEVFEWIVSKPKIVHCSYLITRILDDIAAPKEEHMRGITVSCVTCYMNDHGVSESEAMESLGKMLPSLWKDMNEELLKPNPVPMPVLKLVLNAARMMAQFYCDGIDGYSISEGRTEEFVKSLLIDPIPL
uniref:Delta-elemene synthase-like protein n=1 Tax=Nigella sativa TaxID=555479 RepID=A0A7D5PWT9_NIGSA|nr:delta-elemene synthase-like protein [Nigella sativa]